MREPKIVVQPKYTRRLSNVYLFNFIPLEIVEFSKK